MQNMNIKEGDLYKIVKVKDRTFEIYYGYYDEKERHSRYGELIPIYPDLINRPVYTESGEPCVTGMQDACEHYVGKNREDGCHGCGHYENHDDLMGICSCEKRRAL